jgi:hypothetical protein
MVCPPFGMNAVDRWWARREERLCPPSYGDLCVKASDRLGLGLLRYEGGARSHAKRSAPTGHQVRTGFRRFLQLTASPHIRSDGLVRTHIPHACGEEAMRMRPIYKTAVCSAHGWHGHHPSRTGRGDEPQRRRVGCYVAMPSSSPPRARARWSDNAIAPRSTCAPVRRWRRAWPACRHWRIWCGTSG